MLVAILAINLLVLVLNLIAVFQRKEANNLKRASERERRERYARESDLLDRIMLMKGYREYAPPAFEKPLESPEPELSEEEQELLKEGFVEYT